MNIGILGRQRSGGKNRIRRTDKRKQKQQKNNLVKQWTYLCRYAILTSD